MAAVQGGRAGERDPATRVDDLRFELADQATHFRHHAGVRHRWMEAARRIARKPGYASGRATHAIDLESNIALAARQPHSPVGDRGDRVPSTGEAAGQHL